MLKDPEFLIMVGVATGVWLGRSLYRHAKEPIRKLEKAMGQLVSPVGGILCFVFIFLISAFPANFPIRQVIPPKDWLDVFSIFWVPVPLTAALVWIVSNES